MKEYFYSDGQDQFGPFKPEELKEKKITKETLVWCEGMEDWQKAVNIEELKFLFATMPPPLNKVVTPPVINPVDKITPPPLKPKNIVSSGIPTEEKKKKKKTWLTVIIIVTVVVLIVVVLFLFKDKFINNDNSDSDYSGSENKSYNEQPKQKTEAELKAELEEKEKNKPTNYLSVKSSWRITLFSSTVVDGDVFSSATIAIFKDIKIKVNFLSKTETVLGTDYYTIYDYIKPGGSIHFSVKFNYYYEKAKYISCSIVSAKIAE